MILTYTDDHMAIVEYKAGEVIFTEIVTHPTRLTGFYIPNVSPDCPSLVKNNHYINETITPGTVATLSCQIRYRRKPNEDDPTK